MKLKNRFETFKIVNKWFSSPSWFWWVGFPSYWLSHMLLVIYVMLLSENNFKKLRFKQIILLIDHGNVLLFTWFLLLAIFASVMGEIK
jgi:4-amino-4-deoxy-L-arabinose transferase-like glycosyltransferase